MNSTQPKAGKWTTFFVYAALVLLVGGLAIGQLGINPFASMLSLTAAHLFAIIAAIIVATSAIRARST